MKRILSLLLLLVLSTSIVCASANEYAELKPIPHRYRGEALRDRLITIANSQIDYVQAYNGSTIYHHIMYPNLQRTDYKYDVPWNTLFFAWVFKTAGIYTPTFDKYLAYSKNTLRNRFICAGNTEGELAYAYFDPSYIYDAQPGDIVFLDRFRREKDDYNNLLNQKKISQIALITAKTNGAITVVSPYFQKKVWTGNLNTKQNLHNPYKIMGFGVLDAKPSKETVNDLPMPLIAYEKETGRQMIVYYIYQDGTALTSNGERNIADFLLATKPVDTKMSRKMRFKLYPTAQSKESFGILPDMTEMKILGTENGRTQIVLPWNLKDGKAEFPIYTVAWVEGLE